MTRILCFVAFWLALLPKIMIDAAEEPQRVEVRVGVETGDFHGNDGRVLQAAVNYVSELGGGTVSVGPGRYLLRNSLILKDNIRLVGEPGKTILVSDDAHRSPLANLGGTNERQISVTDATGFRIGDGIMVQDDTSMYGFSVTQATITARLDENTFQISRPLVRDYSLKRNARVTSGFPVVGLWDADNVVIEGLTVDGNRDKHEYLTGCRGGGIFLFECEDVQIRNCTVRNYNGDAISFQATQNVLIEDCVCTMNAGVGLHPGCGTEHALVRRVKSFKNTGDGLFLCLRVKHSVFEDNILIDNERHGISIGHKDSDNLFRDNIITTNTKSGIWFRDQPVSGGAHRNVFENNRVLDNGACVVIQGHHHDLTFRANKIGLTTAGEKSIRAFETSDLAKGLKSLDNEFVNVTPAK